MDVHEYQAKELLAAVRRCRAERIAVAYTA